MPRTTTIIQSFDRIAATIAALVIVGLAVFLLIRNQPIADPRLFFVMRVVLSLSAATLGASIPGFLNLKWSGRGLAARAGGALALFVLTFIFTPDLVKDQRDLGGAQINQHSEGPLSPNIVGNKGNITIQGDGGQKKKPAFIDAQCQPKILTTTPLAPGETLKVLQLWPLPEANGGGGLMDMFITNGNEFVWPKPSENFPFLNGYQCKITNYADAPVFNIDLALQEEFREIIRDSEQPNTMHTGQIKLSRRWPLNILKIDTGISNSFVFYIFNVSDNRVIVSLPEAVTLQIADNTPQDVRLIHSGPMDFWPQLAAR
jgi:hypothetical protein